MSAQQQFPRRKIVKGNPFASVFSVKDIMACDPCYDPVAEGVIPKNWRGTLWDIAQWPWRNFCSIYMCNVGRSAMNDKTFIIGDLLAQRGLFLSRYLLGKRTPNALCRALIRAKESDDV